MPRGKPGLVTVRDDEGQEVPGRLVHAECVLPVSDVELLRDHAKDQKQNYTDFLEQLLREALDPIIRSMREADQERAAALQAKSARAAELRRLIAEQQEELQRLERETRRR